MKRPALAYNINIIEGDVTVTAVELESECSFTCGMPRDAYVQDPGRFTRRMLEEARGAVLREWLSIIDLSQEVRH